MAYNSLSKDILLELRSKAEGNIRMARDDIKQKERLLAQIEERIEFNETRIKAIDDMLEELPV